MTGAKRHDPRIYRNELRWRAAWHRRRGLRSLIANATLPLRFVFGVGRSGTTWMGRVLGEAEQPLRYLQEPWTYARPFYLFGGGHDRLALPSAATLSRYHPLAVICRSLARRRLDCVDMLGRYASQKVLRNDFDAELVLIKEVHALLAAPALVDALAAKAVVVSRDPVYVIDSLFAYQDLSVPIWRQEQHLLQDESVLSVIAGSKAGQVLDALHRYPDDGVDRQNTVIGKALTTALISRSLRLAAERSPDVLHVRYERLCNDPHAGFLEAAHHLDIDLGQRGDDFIKEASSSRFGDHHPTRTVHKDSGQQASRPLKSLSTEEADAIRHVLGNLDLD